MTIKQFGWLALLTVAGFSGRAVAQAPPIIEPTVERHQGPPLWISASAVIDSEKIIDLDRIDSLSLKQYVDKQKDRPRIELHVAEETPTVADISALACVHSLISVCDERTGRDTLADLVRYAQSILLGSVTSVERGFSFGIPGSLLAVELREVLRGGIPGNTIYVDYPVAHFRIGQYYFCSTNTEYEPAPGDQVLLFDHDGPVDREGVFYSPNINQLFFQNAQGELHFSSRLRRDDPEMRGIQRLEQVLARLSPEVPR